MALSASESINSGLRTVVIAVLSATIPHRSTTTPKTKHTHTDTQASEKKYPTLFAFKVFTIPPTLFSSSYSSSCFVLIWVSAIDVIHYGTTRPGTEYESHVIQVHRYWAVPVVSTLWLSMTARWGSIKWALVKTNDKRSAVGGLQRSEVQVVQDVVLMYSVMFKIIIHAISNSQHIFTAK